MRRFETQLLQLRDSLLEMSGLVEAAISHSVHALTAKDPEEAQRVFTAESRINRMQIEIDDMATRLLALEQPVARDLRLIAAVIRINNDLERMGDEAVNIAQRAMLLMHDLPFEVPVDIPHMAALVESMVRKSLDSIVTRDCSLARSVLSSDDLVDHLWLRNFRELIQFMQRDPGKVTAGINIMFIMYNLERIADHATNIAEDVIYFVEGIDVRHHTESAGKEKVG